MPGGHLERHAGAVAEAEEVRLGDAEVAEQSMVEPPPWSRTSGTPSARP
jgi:hypothetical protein